MFSAKVSGAPRRAIAISKDARGAVDARTWSARRWPRPPPFKATSPTFVTGSTDRDGSRRASTVYGAYRPRCAVAAQSRRYRSDHSQAIPEADRALGVRPVPVPRLEARAVVRAQPAAVRGRIN